MKAKKIIKIVAITLAAIIGAAALTVAGYVAYVGIQYYRIEDNISLDVKSNAENSLNRDEKYSVMTYNLGFGAYSPEYSFFMDTGVMKDGKKTSGKYAKGISKEDVQKNVDGQIAVAKEGDADFYFLQETDKKADRSYKINMVDAFEKSFIGYASTYAQNFHTAWLCYPFNDPIGATDAGLLTLSRYKIESATRRSFPVTDNFIDKLFDLDRCFSVHYLPVGGSDKYLALINLHMSAYDEGGTIRAEQLKLLNSVLKEEYEKGNYVVAGGDFNHCLIADRFQSDEEALNYFESGQLTPDWVKNSVIHDSELTKGFKIISAINVSTCRGADTPYEEGVTYTTVIDGFIISENVQCERVENIDTGYKYSDHNPVKMEFILK